MTQPESPTGKRPETVRIWLLGGFRVSVGSRTIKHNRWRLRSSAALVKLLALAPGHRIHREQVIDLLWPDCGRRTASNSLRQALYAARKALDPAAGSRYLASEDESLVLCPGRRLWVDIEAFVEAAATARRARDPAAYEAALDLYTGDLLPEDRYEEWAENRRDELRQLYVALLVELAKLYEQRGEYGPAVEALRRAVAEKPTLEEVHTALMRLYAIAGQPGEALAQYERLRDVLSRGFGTEPGAMTRRLRDEIAAGKLLLTPPAGPSPEESSDASRHNLPAARTSFVGREREMVEVTRALAMTQLLTLTGAGGSGKTRLALDVARDLLGAYADGVWLVELAPLSEPELVLQEVASTLEIREQPGRPLADTLVHALREKKMLLVVDNCEHLIDACARLVDTLLGACSHLRVLATSREALRVTGETSWPVPSLTVPEAGEDSPTVESLTRYEAVRLFVERARSRLPSFALTPENVHAAVEVCRGLEGIPLAIELAATRVGVLSVQQISERLGRSLKLLTDDRVTDPRHRALRATLDWSHELLSEDEKKLFRLLSAFSGGWSLEAAEAVGAAGSVEEEDVLDLLDTLVEKSLVVVEESWERGARYGMLEPVRQYARAKLEESGESEAILRRHAEYYLELAERAKPKLRGPRQVAWLELLETEHDNFRAVLSWALGRRATEPDEHAELGVRLAAALWRFWEAHGHPGEGRRWLEAVLSESCGPPVARAEALNGAG